MPDTLTSWTSRLSAPLSNVVVLIIFAAFPNQALLAQNFLESGINRLNLTGCAIIGSEIQINGSGNFHTSKAYLDSQTMLEEIDMYFRVRVESTDSSGNFLYAAGKYSSTAGTMLEISGNADSSKLVIDRLSGLIPTSVKEYPLPFIIDTGDVYTVRIGKRLRNLVIEIYNSVDYFYLDSIAYPETFWGCFWGTPFIAANKGKIAITDFSLTTPFSIAPRLTVWGDSFIEGNSLDRIGDRYISLLQDSIGHNNVTITACGGETSANMNWRFPLESRWFKGSKYALLAVGLNDVSFSTWLLNMQRFMDTLQKHNVIPILVTLTPRSDRPGFIASVNNYIRNVYEGAYIDVAMAVSSDGSWLPGMVKPDSIHPTEAGHKAIWQRVQLDAPYFFGNEVPPDQKADDPLLYPNPFSDKLSIQDVQERVLITIYSADGRVVRAAKIEDGNTEIETSLLDAGMYIVNIRNEIINRNFKVVKR